MLTAVQLLAKNFAAMQRLGDPVLKPFLQVCMPVVHLLMLCIQQEFVAFQLPCMMEPALLGCKSKVWIFVRNPCTSYSYSEAWPFPLKQCCWSAGCGPIWANGQNPVWAGAGRPGLCAPDLWACGHPAHAGLGQALCRPWELHPPRQGES